MSRPCALITLFSLASLLPALTVNPGTPSPVSFADPQIHQPGRIRAAILADRTTGVDEGIPVLRQAVEEIAADQPDFVLTIGDMVNGYTRREGEWLRQFTDEWQAIVAPLEVPIFPTAGNHDVRPGTHNPGDTSAEQLFQDHFAPLHYSFDVERTHFVMLYSDDGLPQEGEVRIGSAQMDWLRQDLAQADADHIFVLIHRPLWMVDGSNWDEIHSLLAATGKCRAVIGGHTHTYEFFPERDGIQYLVLGTTGGVTSGVPAAGGIDHWCRLTVEGPEWQIETKQVGGEWLPLDFVRHEDAEVRRQIEYLGNREAGVQTPLREPGPGAVRDEAIIHLANPTGTALPVSVELAAGRGDGWRMEPAFVRTSLAANSSADFEVIFRHEGIDQIDPVTVEPQLNITYRLTDSQGRTYPVTLERRVAWLPQVRVLPQTQAVHTVDARRTIPEGWEGAFWFGLPTWNSAPWETREPGGRVGLAWTGDEEIHLFARISDDSILDEPGNESDMIASDALVLRALSASGEEQALAIFPYRDGGRNVLRVVEGQPETQWPEVAGIEVAQRTHNAANDTASALSGTYGTIRLWEVSVPLEAWMGADWQRRVPIPVNVEVLDNDGLYFTSVRSWAPRWSPRNWAQIAFGPSQ